MARVTFRNGLNNTPLFAPQPDPEAVSETANGLIWRTDLLFPQSGEVVFRTSGGELGTNGEPTGVATSVSLLDASGATLFIITGATIEIGDLLGGADQGPDGNFWTRLLAGKDIVVGAPGDEIIQGYGGADKLYGKAGDDTLFGGRGADTLDGGEGLDTADFRGLAAGGAIDLVAGTAIFAGDADTLISIENAHGGSGNDTITGSNGANVLHGDSGADLINGGAGDDTILAGDGRDTIDGGAGYDTADFSDWSHGEGGLINLSTGRAVFNLSGRPETDVLRRIENAVGSDGGDTIIGTVGANALEGNDGDDQLHGGRSRDTLSGGDGDDVLQGGEHADILNGDAGSDALYGGVADDSLYGGDGDDQLYGGVHDDLLEGGAGDDVLSGSDGNDTFSGGDGRNSLKGSYGDDVFLLGSGVDYVKTGRDADVLVTDGSGGSAVVSDFDFRFDVIRLDVAGADLPSVEDLIASGDLSITGDARKTLITFEDSTIRLDRVALSDFSADLLFVV